MSNDVAELLASVGARLRSLRTDSGRTLAEISALTGISTSTLSRLESGKRKATLEMLVPLAQIYRVPLDDLVSLGPPSDPRVRKQPVHHDGVTFVALSSSAGPQQAYKVILHPDRAAAEPEPRVHEGYEWLYVLSGRLRLVLGSRELVLDSGEAAEFDTRTPHCFGNADENPVEILILFSEQGERVHLRAGPARS